MSSSRLALAAPAGQEAVVREPSASDRPPRPDSPSPAEPV